MKEAPRLISRRRFIAGSTAILGAGIADAACGGSKPSTTGSPVPGFVETNIPPTVIRVPATEIPTQAPTEVPATPAPTEVPAPVANPRETGLYASIEEMPIPTQVQEKMKELTGNFEVTMKTKTGVIAVENGLDKRATMTQVGPVNPKQIDTSAITGMWFNTKKYPNAPEMYDELNAETLAQIADRDGGSPIIVAYKGDTGKIAHNPVEDPTKVIFLDKFLNEAIEQGSTEMYMVGLSGGNAATWKIHEVDVDGVKYYIVENKFVAADFAGNTLDGNHESAAAFNLNASRAYMALPGVKTAPFDGKSPHVPTAVIKEGIGAKLRDRLSTFTMPNRATELKEGKIETSIIGTNGMYLNRKDLIHPNYK